MRDSKSTTTTRGIPSPDERPDLYDAYDGAPRSPGWVNPIRVSSRLKDRIASRRKQQSDPSRD